MSLFICISKMLLHSAWVATTGALKVGAEVTCMEHTSEPFWGTVVRSGGDTEDSIYTIEDEFGGTSEFRRSELRARVWYTVAQVSKQAYIVCYVQ